MKADSGVSGTTEKNQERCEEIHQRGLTEAKGRSAANVRRNASTREEEVLLFTQHLRSLVKSSLQGDILSASHIWAATSHSTLQLVGERPHYYRSVEESLWRGSGAALQQPPPSSSPLPPPRLCRQTQIGRQPPHKGAADCGHLITSAWSATRSAAHFPSSFSPSPLFSHSLSLSWSGERG